MVSAARRIGPARSGAAASRSGRKSRKKFRRDVTGLDSRCLGQHILCLVLFQALFYSGQIRFPVSSLLQYVAMLPIRPQQ